MAILYDRKTGRIERVNSATKDNFRKDWIKENQEIIDGMVEIKSFYVDVENKNVIPRPEMPVTLNGNILTVPLNTQFKVIGAGRASGVTEDGVIEFEFSEPGTYIVKLTNFPYLDAEVTLESHS